MTPEEFAARSCFNKVPFASRREARQRQTQHLARLGGGRVAPYRCRITPDHWHLGHQAGKSIRKRSGL